ncbi:MAG: response regulator transcription factor [Anaerolineales bacterium]|nr:response regulator transcription factor [Anaerolineales bacterium]
MSAKILIVDDEKAVRESLEEILKLEDYQVEIASSGEKALELINENDYALVLLDLKMSGIDGVEVMKQISRYAPETKVIILTGHGTLESAIEALRTGAEDYMLKPFEASTILDSIGRALSKNAQKKRKELLIEQLESSLDQLKDVEGITTPEMPSRRVITLPQGIMVDLERREMWRGGERAHLTPTEGKLLSVFLENRGRVMSHKEIVFLVQGYETSEWEAPEVLRPMISRLRKKLATFPDVEEWVENVRGTGYVFDPK